MWLLVTIVSIFSIGTLCLIIDIIYYGEESVTIEYKHNPTTITNIDNHNDYGEVIMIEGGDNCII